MTRTPLRSLSSRLAGGLLAVTVLGLQACASFEPRPSMPISEVIQSAKESPDRAVDRVRGSRTTYALRGSDFGRLAEMGVAPAVLDYLQQSFYDDVDRLTRNWVLGESLGGCKSCYPQPVDLGNLAAGGNGMGDTSRLGREATFSRPQGLPDWVTASPGGMGGPGITLDAVERMIKEGKPADEIVATIERSRAHDAIPTGSITRISTHLATGLKGSDLARLHGEGAGDAVLDVLQKKYLAEYIDFFRMRYMHEGKGHSYN